MRKLASIQRITDITPIEGKDRIALASVLGWHVIINKADFNVGDLCVYVEIDSVMPERPEFEFLRKCNFRIKTMKMAGVLSQGICFPLSIIKEEGPGHTLWAEGADVTKLIDIKQYEPEQDDPLPEETSPKKKHSKFFNFLMRFRLFRRIVGPRKKTGLFPSFVPKTDEVRIQTMPDKLCDKTPYVLTEKVDGCSGTYVLVRKRFLWVNRDQFIVCSRNRALPHDDGRVYWDVAKKYDIKKALSMMLGKNKWIAVQGECVGPKIQGNKYKFKENKFFAFNVITPSGRWPSLKAKQELAHYGINFVPIISERYRLPDTVDEMLALAHGQSRLGDTLREGLVCRSLNGQRSFKAVDPEFLLKYNG